MTEATMPSWEAKRTPESCQVEEVLRQAGFQKVDAYRYNSASIRVRVIDPRFSGKCIEERDALVEPHLEKLPEGTQADILMLLTLAPEEISISNVPPKFLLLNVEFDDPRPSML